MWTFDRNGPLPLWRAETGNRAVLLASSTRQGGISGPPYHALNLGRSTADRPEAVEENRRRLLAGLGLNVEGLVTAGQVHGARAVRVEEPGHVSVCDALVTTRPGLILAVTTADCMSLLFTVPGAVAVAHSGWRGTAERMPTVALTAVCAAAGRTPAEVMVLIGPCIRSCCYEVGEEVARAFRSEAVLGGAPRPHLDLPLAARLQLEEAGVPAAAIHDCGACTSCEPHWYYSYRRDGPASGRHWSLAALRM
ncbi:MAG: polyphenol oxidase family protein [Candidatus Eisenbacteria bacterium]